MLFHRPAIQIEREYADATSLMREFGDSEWDVLVLDIDLKDARSVGWRLSELLPIDVVSCHGRGWNEPSGARASVIDASIGEDAFFKGWLVYGTNLPQTIPNVADTFSLNSANR